MRVGIDFGGTSIKIGLVEDDFNIAARFKVPTLTERGVHGMMEDTARGVLDMLRGAHVSMEDIDSIGMGIPGGVDNVTGVVYMAANLGLKNAPVREILSKILGRSVFVANDADSAVYGELIAGAAKGSTSAVLVTLGTGVGSGIIINSEIYNGAYHCGAEIGHMVIERAGRPCTCGRRGCFEAYCSASGIINMTRDAALADSGSLLNSYGEITGATAFDAAKKGDTAAKRVVEEFIDCLGTGLINIANIFQPEVLMVGGGVSHEGEYILEPIRKSMTELVHSRFSDRQTKLCMAALGNDAGIIGAAFLK
ncbi:MAG: ROK family protein [Clostridia bacterium]|nr:ROK family protein [Clostridia bacterium]